MTLPASNLDRRHHPRLRTLLAGRIAFGDPLVNAACTIRSLTEDGAMVELETPILLSGPLQLLVIARGEAYDIELAWARGMRVGVKLKTRYELKDNPPQARYLQALWRQTAPR